MAERLDDDLAHGLVESGPDALVLADEAGQIVFVNTQAEALFGYSSTELVGQPIELLVPESLRRPHTELRSGYAAAPRHREMGTGLSLRCRRRDGTELPVEIRLSPIRTRRGLFTAAAVRDLTERHKADRALREAEERFRLTFDNAPIGMVITALSGRFLRVNQALCRMLGFSAEELTQRTFLEITHPEDRELHRASTERLERGEIRSYQIAKRYLRKDGSVVHILLSVSIARDAEGTPRYFIGQIEDVTERRQIEEALRRSEDHLNRAQRVAHIGSWDWDLQTDEVHRSAELYEILGASPDPGYRLALSYMGTVHPSDRERVSSTIRGAVRTGSSFYVEYRLLRADGSQRFIVSQGEPVLHQGRAVRMVGTILDVTQRKHLELAREEALRWLRTVLDQCPVAIGLVRAQDGARITLNRYAQSLLGGTAEASRPLEDLRLLQESGASVSEPDHPCTRALAGETVLRLPFTLKTATGAAVPVLVDAAPIRDDAGAVHGAVVVLQDITLLKQLEQLRAEWNSVVAHDLRQPVNAILLISQLVARGKRDPAEYAKLAAQIAQSAVGLNGLINDLLDSSRIEAGQLSLKPGQVALPPLLRDCVERSQLAAPDRPFEVQIADDIPTLHVDGARINQVLDNLLSNAIKYGTPKTPITVSAEVLGPEVTVAITNLGAGIALEDIPSLFQRFHRTSSARQSAIRGIGLGLYIVKQLVTAHGGQIAVTSTQGQSTTFRFSLPVAKPPGAHARSDTN